MMEFVTATKFNLKAFLPYRFSILRERASESLARIYRDRHRLRRTEWRLIAALGDQRGLSAGELAALTAMTNVKVSRAIKRLIARGLLDSAADDADLRRKILRLTAAGRRVFNDIAPKALQWEADMLARLSPAERDALPQILNKLDRLFSEQGL